MRGLYFDGKLILRDDLPRPIRVPGEAIVRVSLAGICNTDIEILKGYMGFKGIPGHEFVGIVEECEAESLLGQRVVGEINCSCGKCSFCSNGLENHCPERTVLGILSRDGSFAEYLTLPEKNLHLVPSHLADQEAVFAEPLAAAFEILEQVKMLPSARVVVLGDGKLGLLVAQVLRLNGSHVTLIGKHRSKLSIVGPLGVETLQIKPHGDLLLLWDEGGKSFRLEDKKAEVVVECTGSHSGFEIATRLVRPRGSLVMKSTVVTRGRIDLARLVLDEINLVGSRCGPFPPSLRAMSQGLVKTTPLISHIFPLEKGVQAMEVAARKGVLKVLIRI